MSNLEQWARLDGQLSRIRGAIAFANPHAPGSALSEAWLKGWLEVEGAERRTTCSCGAKLAPTNKSGRCHLCATRDANGVRTLPADFAEHAQCSTNSELEERYNCCGDIISRWRREAGVPSKKNMRRSESAPEGFAKVAPTLTKKALRERYHRSGETITRWLDEAGVSCKTFVVGEAKVASPRAYTPPPVNLAEAIRAATFLQRFGPVTRCNDAGAYDPKGYHWRRGSAVLCADEIIDRAARQGFNADAWREVQAA